MIFIAYNFSWIVFNLVLALIPVLLTIALERKLNRFARFVLLFFWFIFLPNTIYLITDIQYLPIQFLTADLSERIALLIQYGVVIFLGIATYFYSLKPLEKIVAKSKAYRSSSAIIFVILNLIVAFAVTLGKFTRVHSWYLFTEPINVINSIFEVLFTPKFLLYFLLFGVLVNLIYFYTNGYFKKNHRRTGGQGKR